MWYVQNARDFDTDFLLKIATVCKFTDVIESTIKKGSMLINIWMKCKNYEPYD